MTLRTFSKTLLAETLFAYGFRLFTVPLEHRDPVDGLKHGAVSRVESLMREHACKSGEALRNRFEAIQTLDQADDIPGLRLVVG
jgi:hypothetical protein